MAKISYRVRPETAVLNKGFDPKLSVGSARPPVYRSSTFVFPSPEAAERMLAIWRRTGAQAKPVHEAAYWDDERRGARALSSPPLHKVASTCVQPTTRFKAGER